MQGHVEFARNAVLPSWWANAIGRATSVGADGLRLEPLPDRSGVRVQAESAAGRGVVVKIAGRWRWIESTVARAHPGGSQGVYDVFATAKANDIRSVPQAGTDATDYAFALAIVPGGQAPTLGAGVEIVQPIGRCVWNGSRVVAVAQTVGGSAVDDLLQRTPSGTVLGPGIPPIGATSGWASDQQPADTTWRLLNGAALGTVSEFPDLALACPQMVDGSQITLADYRERITIGPGTVDGTSRSVGQKFGADRVTLTVGQLASHGHAITGANMETAPNEGGFAIALYQRQVNWGAIKGVPNAAGNSESHPNVPRVIVENRIIRVR